MKINAECRCVAIERISNIDATTVGDIFIQLEGKDYLNAPKRGSAPLR